MFLRGQILFLWTILISTKKDASSGAPAYFPAPLLRRSGYIVMQSCSAQGAYRRLCNILMSNPADENFKTRSEIVTYPSVFKRPTLFDVTGE